ncbi:MAG TPA: ABC transporter permease [Pseudolabrys sp.]|nr:ABC transporter permease [Pseudolabrys sp.]
MAQDDTSSLKARIAAPGAGWKWPQVKPSFWQGLASFIIAAVLWEIVARVVVKNPLFFTSLVDVVERGIALWQSGELQTHIWTSFVEFAGGYLLAAVLGILGGIGMAASKTARGFFDPWMSMLYSTPILALGPLFILWLGIGMTSKIAVIFMVAVFPILINTLVGLTTTDRLLLDVGRSLGATPHQLYLKVRIPAALPYIIAGLRLSVARALVGVVVAELFGARAGLGFLILQSAQSFDTAAMFVGVVILAAAGVGSVALLKLVERKMAPWRFENVDD